VVVVYCCYVVRIFLPDAFKHGWEKTVHNPKIDFVVDIVASGDMGLCRLPDLMENPILQVCCSPLLVFL
jgi:hypothetical protein